MELSMIKNIVEAALFAAGRPMSMNELLRLFSEDERPERKDMRDVIKQLVEEYDNRGIELIEVASGYRVQVRHQMGEWLGRLSERRPPRYSRALMETLALIAYRQPITRGDIEEVRGVSVSTNIIRTLLERGWARIVGHRDVPGRPAMFGTTKEFLDYFNLKSLDELPSLAELTDVDSINAELDFGDTPYDDLEDEGELADHSSDEEQLLEEADVSDDESLIEESSVESEGEQPETAEEVDSETPKNSEEMSQDADDSESESMDEAEEGADSERAQDDDDLDSDDDHDSDDDDDHDSDDDDDDDDDDFEGWDVDEEDSESDDELESMSA